MELPTVIHTWIYLFIVWVRLLVATVRQAFALLEGDYGLSVTHVNVLEGEDSEKKIKQMKTFSGGNTVPQVKTCDAVERRPCS